MKNYLTNAKEKVVVIKDEKGKVVVFALAVFAAIVAIAAIASKIHSAFEEYCDYEEDTSDNKKEDAE